MGLDILASKKLHSQEEIDRIKSMLKPVETMNGVWANDIIKERICIMYFDFDKSMTWGNWSCKTMQRYKSGPNKGWPKGYTNRMDTMYCPKTKSRSLNRLIKNLKLWDSCTQKDIDAWSQFWDKNSYWTVG